MQDKDFMQWCNHWKIENINLHNGTYFYLNPWQSVACCWISIWIQSDLHSEFQEIKNDRVSLCLKTHTHTHTHNHWPHTSNENKCNSLVHQVDLCGVLPLFLSLLSHPWWVGIVHVYQEFVHPTFSERLKGQDDNGPWVWSGLSKN